MEKGNEKDINESRQKIATLIFMDLETTGLPSDVGKKNVHITELCMVAIDRNSFENDKNLRVINKLNLCIRPRSVVSHGAMAITGLYNDNLDNQEEFDDSVPKLLEYFFRRLQSPICLLAHNGNRFDFPVLQAELKRINYALNYNILCADTLVAFRSICLSHKQEKDAEKGTNGEKEHIPPLKISNCVQMLENNQSNISTAPKDTDLAKIGMEVTCPEQKSNCIPINEDDIDVLLSQDLESFTCVDISLKLEQKDSFKSESNEIPSTELNLNIFSALHKTHEAKSSDFVALALDERTPPRSKIPPNINESIKCIHRKRKMSNDIARENGHKEPMLPVKRTLFPKQDPLPLNKITKFSLENLYKHFFFEDPPNSHFAEVDCVSLSKVCQKVSQEFLQWVDANSVNFSSIDPFW